MPDHVPAGLAAALASGGEMGGRIAAFDWAAHPLGPKAQWGSEMRTAVAVAVTSRSPVVVWLGGSQLFCLYNDACIDLLGDRHPSALGAPCAQGWPELWEVAGRLLVGTVQAPTAGSAEVELAVVAAGQTQHHPVSLSAGPLFASDAGVSGVFCTLADAALGPGSEAGADRARELLEFRAALNAAEAAEDVAAAFLDSPAASAGADAVSLGVLDRDTDTLRVSFLGDIPAEHRDRYYVVAADGPGPMAEAMRTGRVIVVENSEQGEERHRSVLRDFGGILQAFMFHPLRGPGGMPIGAITLAWFVPRTFTPEELDGTAASVALAGAALARVRAAESERRIAIDLQDHLLDLNRSSTAAAVAAMYQPAGEAMRVGGDWYLVAPAEDPHRVAFCVGDVVGRGLAAASVMSRLRSAIAAASGTFADPAAVLDLVERYARTVRGAHCSTVAYAVLDANDRSLRYACAGHPYPLVVDPDGRTRYLDQGRRPPLSAVYDQAAQAVGTTELPPGSLLVLYTDGLIERRGEPLEEGLARLAETAAGCASLPVGSVCATLLERLAPPRGYTDDVALLAVRPEGTTERSFVDVLPADLHEMVHLRHRLRDWLPAACPDEGQQYDVLIGVGEALSNAIDHGSQRHPDSTVSVEVFAEAAGLSATVSDTGRWAGDSSASQREAVRGRGLKLIHALSTHVETVRTSHGTQVTMHHELQGVRIG